MINRAHQLSIHPTMQCDYDCFGCYLKKDEVASKPERDKEFFLGLVDQAHELGMTEIAVPLNYVKKSPDFQLLDDPSDVWDKVDRNVYLWKWIKERTKMHGMRFITFVNYDAILSYQNDLDFSDVDLMGISINDFVTKERVKKNEAIQLFKDMRSAGVKSLNCNILLTEGIITQLNNGLAEEILEVADTIYLLMSQPLFIPLETVYSRIRKLKDSLMTMLNERVYLDSCILREMGMTGGACSRHDMIYVNPYGEIKKCMYDKEDLYVLKTAEDLKHVYNNLHPQEPLQTCHLVTNGDKLKAERDAAKKLKESVA